MSVGKDAGQALDVDCLERCLAVTELIPTTWSVHLPFLSTSPQYHALPPVTTLVRSPLKGKNGVRRQTRISAF